MKREKLNHLILAEGEVTGHAHRASCGVLYREKTGVLTLEPGVDACTITHEEHTPQTVATPHHVEIVREFDHAAEEARNVAD